MHQVTMNSVSFRIGFFTLILLFSCALVFGQDDFNFKHIKPQIQNKDVFISKTVQDSLGNIWMNYGGGILKYNGYNYRKITKFEIFPNIKNSDGINFISTDNSKNIWIKTAQGQLSKYDSKKGEFHDFSNLINEPISICNSNSNKLWVVTITGKLYYFNDFEFNFVTSIPNLDNVNNKAESIEVVNNNQVFIGTSKGKIYNYSIKSQTLNELIGPFTDYPASISLKADNSNKLWIGTETFGLLVYDVNSKKFITNSLFKNSAHNLSKELFINLFLDSSNNIWGGTDGDGLYKINSINGDIKVYKKDNFNEFSLSSNTVIDINEDQYNNIWVVNKYGSIDIIPKANHNVHYIKGSENNIPLRILSIYKSKKGVLWIGSDGNGLTKIEQEKNSTKQYFNDSKKGFYVQSITEDENENIWFGTYKNGLWKFDSKKNTFKNIVVENDINHEATDIRTVFTDSKKRIWVGSNVSLNIYAPDESLLASFKYNDNGLNGTITESIIEDTSATIWLGVYGGGLFKFKENLDNINNSSFTNFNNNGTISTITSMCIGKPNEIIIVKDNGSPLLFDINKEKFFSFDNLRTPTITSILSSDPYNLWMGSSNGIHHFDRKKNLVKVYYTSDGFQSNSFVSRSAFRDSNGMIYFGTNHGINFFKPELLTKEKSDVKFVVNDVQVLNKSAKNLLKDQIKSDIYNFDKLYLENNQSSFSVTFSVIDNILDPNHYYSYKLEGFEEEWRTTYSEATASYTNLPSGEYILKMKAYGLNEPSVIAKKDIAIVIHPPFWKTPVAYLLYLALLALLIYLGVKWYYLRKKLLVNKISRRKENELHEAKMNFFAKMSHEIQTPITLILGPVEDMLKRAEVNGNLLLKERLNIISNNANRLSRIAQQLTLARNKDLSRLKLLVTENNLHNDITKVCLSFNELARNKKIDFSINCPKNLDKAWYDREKLEHILYNLLSNAFKFTPPEGNVQLTVTPNSKKSNVRIIISDSGQGIKKEELDDIFKLFYRTNNAKASKGMGIGLALTKELVSLHRGKIKVKSASGDGTTFIIKIPISEQSYNDSERITSSKESHTVLQTKNEIDNIKEVDDFDKTKKTILIVEDNFELQSFLKNLLKKTFNILLAENGEEGYYYAKNNIPDLIISDIMMPKMDGIEMCRELKKNKLTNHIPVIMLTAKNSTNAKIEGLKTGAIEFISKPFNTSELLLKVNNIIASKENIISKYRKELINKPQIKISKTQDEVFLENLTETVNENLKNPNFKVDELAELLNMSYSSLYRKCSTVTGMNLIDFVRHLRLKKAAVLMVNYGYNISQVAYMVGFNDPKYFTKSFKKHFALTPKDFKNKAQDSSKIHDFLKEHGININDLNQVEDPN